MLGPPELMSIPNPWLLQGKLKSLVYSFTPVHVLGKLHMVPDNMSRRAITCVYWPYMKEDITSTRAACTSCNFNTPSNHKQPPKPIVQPHSPFSDICMDFFEYASHSFLVIVDRYSNWMSLVRLDQNNSTNVIKHSGSTSPHGESQSLSQPTVTESSLRRKSRTG